jgi:hypothetical protein
MQQFLVGPDNPFLSIGFDIADSLEQGVSGFRYFLRHENLWTFSHDDL